MDGRYLVSREDELRFERICSNIMQSPTETIIKNLSDLLTKNRDFLFKTFYVEDLRGSKCQTNLVLFAVYSYNPSLLKKLATFAHTDQAIWRKFKEQVGASFNMNLDEYYAVCRRIISILKQYRYDDCDHAIIATADKEKLRQFRSRLPLTLQQKYKDLFDANSIAPSEGSLDEEIKIIKAHAELNTKEITTFFKNPEGALAAEQEAARAKSEILARAREKRRAKNQCKPYREDEPVKPNDNNRLTEEQLLALCKPETRQYIINKKKEKPLNEQFEELNATDREVKLYARNMKDCEDPFTLEVMSIPLVFQGVAFEWSSIISNYTREGTMFVPPAPHSHRKFEIGQLDPGILAEQLIQLMIDTIKDVREDIEKEKVKELLKSIDPNNAEPVLIEACTSGNLLLVKGYLEKFKDQPDKVNLAKNPKGDSAILCAILNGHDKVLDALLTFPGIDISQRWNGFNLLMVAISHVSKACYDLLADKFDINSKSVGREYTALMVALLSVNNTEIIRHLLSNPRLDLSITDATGKTAIDMAREKNDPIISNMFDDVLARHLDTAFTNNPINISFIEMSMKFYGERLALHIVNTPTGKTPFIVALVKFAPVELVEKGIILFKAHLNTIYTDWSLLHYAAKFRPEASILSCLIREGCTQVNTKDPHFGQTPLMLAAKEKSAAKMEVLINEGKADLTLQNGKGKDALHYVTERQTVVVPKDQACAELLVKADKRLTLQTVTMFRVVPAQQQDAAAPELRK